MFFGLNRFKNQKKTFSRLFFFGPIPNLETKAFSKLDSGRDSTRLESIYKSVFIEGRNHFVRHIISEMNWLKNITASKEAASKDATTSSSPSSASTEKKPGGVVRNVVVFDGSAVHDW